MINLQALTRGYPTAVKLATLHPDAERCPPFTGELEHRPERVLRVPDPETLMGAGDLFAAELPAVVAEEAAAVGDGRVAVLGPATRVDELHKLIPTASGDDLDAPVSVLTVAQAKGLEFDAVVLVDPATMVAESPRGLNDLYVALTRTTHRLAIVHPGDLPEPLAALQR